MNDRSSARNDSENCRTKNHLPQLSSSHLPRPTFLPMTILVSGTTRVHLGLSTDDVDDAQHDDSDTLASASRSACESVSPWLCASASRLALPSR